MNQPSVAKAANRTFYVAIAGLGTQGLKVIERIFDVTRYRQRGYQLVAINGLDENNVKQFIDADIRIANTGSQLAVDLWQHVKNDLSPQQQRPLLELCEGQNKANAADELKLSWPINPSRLLHVLDNYTIRHLDYYPEFEIGAENSPSPADVKNIQPEQPHRPSSTQPTALHGASVSVNILVADDSLAVRRQLKLEFDTMNATLDSVADGASALNAAEKKAYDLILLDVVMPGMDGYAACKAIKRTSLNKNTPVIMLTSRSSRFDKLKGILAGCDTYLTKPVNHNEFKSVTNKHLNQSEKSLAR